MEEKEKKQYLKNKELMAELRKCIEQDKVTERMGMMFMLLSERNTRHRYFSRYTFREDLASVGVLACMKAWRSFDIDNYDNPFAFFTSTIHRAFIQYIKKYYDQKNIQNEVKVQNGLEPEHGYNEMKQEKEERDQAKKDGEVEKEKEETVVDDPEEREYISTDDVEVEIFDEEDFEKLYNEVEPNEDVDI